MSNYQTRLKEISHNKSVGLCHVERSTNNGAEVWQDITATGSMRIARFGHAGFDASNAELYTLLNNSLDELIELIDAAEDAVALCAHDHTRLSTALQNLNKKSK